jgi:hypothetical protein
VVKGKGRASTANCSQTQTEATSDAGTGTDGVIQPAGGANATPRRRAPAISLKLDGGERAARKVRIGEVKAVGKQRRPRWQRTHSVQRGAGRGSAEGEGGDGETVAAHEGHEWRGGDERAPQISAPTDRVIIHFAHTYCLARTRWSADARARRGSVHFAHSP